MSDLRLQIQAEKIRELEKQRMIDQLQRQLEQAKADVDRKQMHMQMQVQRQIDLL